MTEYSGPAFPLATSSWDEAEYADLQAVIAKGRFTMGPLVAQFEREFAAAFGAGYAVMVNSGSSANLIAVEGADRAVQLARIGLHAPLGSGVRQQINENLGHNKRAYQFAHTRE